MAAILIVAHAPLASALVSVAAHAYPECSTQLLALDVARDEGPDDVVGRVLQALDAQGSVDALILTDAVGATPHMGAWRAAEARARVRLVAGVNVPMLWRTLCYRDEPLDALVARASDGGRLGIVQMAPTRPANQGPSAWSHGQDLHHDQQ
jgi:mannose PTS system EIIA component